MPGGIERIIVNTANLFTKKGLQVNLLILDKTTSIFYPLHQQIKPIFLPLSFGITKSGNIVSRKIKLISDVLSLRKQIKFLTPQVIICTEYPFATAALLTGAKKYCKIISWEHHHFHELKKNRFWDKLFKMSYPNLNAVVCLNNDEKKLFLTVNKNPVVIPNFIQTNHKSTRQENKTILTVARLTNVKGIDLLLETAKKILSKHQDWKWKTIGMGDQKNKLLQFIENENLQNRLICQQPVHHNIDSEYLNASLYVLTSRNECFPMTLLEALATGLPCISFDCETGPRHIITHNEDGLLVEKENPAKLAEAISYLINNEDKRKKMGEKAFENMQRFSPDKIYKLWEKIL